MNPLRTMISQMGLQKPDGYSPYAAGDKRYGLEGRGNAQSGPMGAQGMHGYAAWDRQVAAKKQAMLNKMQAGQAGNYMSPKYQRSAY